MKITKQKSYVFSGLSPMEHIEKIGRVCYKSEDKIAEGTAKKFVKQMYNNKHHAMLEHYRFIMEVSPVIYDPLSKLSLKHFELTNDGRFVISFNARSLINMVEDSHCADYGYLPMSVSGIRDELIGHICKAYGCYELFGRSEDDTILLSTGVNFIPNSPSAMTEYEWNRHGWRSIGFVTDRGITHELVRHREETSFAQESTRYCNYGIDRFGKEIAVIDQGFGEDSDEYAWWYDACKESENTYFKLLEFGVKPQMARSVLPTCLKAEIVITAPIYEWEHIMNLRYYGITGAPHPMVRALMEPLIMEGVFNYEKN